MECNDLKFVVDTLSMHCCWECSSFLTNLHCNICRNSNLTAADVVNKLEEKDLHKILKNYGQEKKARQITRRIVEHREMLGPLTTTRELQDLVADVYR